MTYPFSAGEILTATNLNLVATPDSVTTWSSPIAGGITVGAGTTVARYIQAGCRIEAYFKFTLGAGSAITGDVSLTLPVAATVQRDIGLAYFEDSSDATARTLGVVQVLASTTVAQIRPVVASGTYANIATALSATVPFTWASGDIIVANLSYFAA